MSSASDISGDVITRMLAIEGGAFAMTCTGVISIEGSKIMGVPTTLDGPAAVPIEGGGFTAIYAPNGRKIAQSKDQFSEELVTAEIDLDDIHRHKQMADCIGH
jgi:nitrilase